MTEHPLTEEMMDKIHGDEPGYSNPYDEDDMRSAADWQLEQDQKELKYFLEEFSCRGHSADAVLDLRAFVNNFQNIMRPATQDNS